MNKVSEIRLHSAWWTLRLSFGLVPFLAGLDKFFKAKPVHGLGLGA